MNHIESERKRNKDFAKVFNKVKAKLNKLKSSRELRTRLINDLYSCENIDLIYYLSAEKYRTALEYVECINSWVDLETTAHEMPYKPKYRIGKMKPITKYIRLWHLAKEK